jgi:oligoendopeptidase F
MFAQLPDTAQAFSSWDWPRIAPYFDELTARPLDAANIAAWLKDWTQLASLISEAKTRLEVAVTVDTTDKAAEERYMNYLENIMEPFFAAEQKLKQKLLDSGLSVPGYEVPLRGLRADAALFREANLPLETEVHRLSSEYARIVGAQTVEVDGKELTLAQVRPLRQTPDRATRERLWRLTSQRQLADRAALNELWVKLLGIRRQIAANAGEPDYRAYRWKELHRLDYTADDALRFDDAIEQAVVPAAKRIYERNRQRLGVDRLRPWDVNNDLDPLHLPALVPYTSPSDLETTTGSIFNRVDPQLGAYYDIMRHEHLLDLPNRKGKAPGGYCTEFMVAKRPFIFMNAVGLHDDVQTLLHEGGHAFHAFETVRLPYFHQYEVPTEFAEVASMSMELLGGPFLGADQGGFYADPKDAARARIEHLEGLILFWPYMAVVDLFQHWVYTHIGDATDPAKCDATWTDLVNRFMPSVDYTGFEDARATGWHRKLHIFELPFYYVEYGLAQLGAVQVWRNSLSDRADAVRRYRSALALGNTATLPDLFAAAGAQFKPDATMLTECVALVESELEKLEAV